MQLWYKYVKYYEGISLSQYQFTTTWQYLIYISLINIQRGSTIGNKDTSTIYAPIVVD